MNSFRGHTVWLAGLTVLVAFALALAGTMLWSVWQLAASARATLDQAIEWTDELGQEKLSFEFPVSTEVPVAMEVPFEETFRVPINHEIAVQTEIAIDEVVEIPLSTPLGTWNLKVPVKMTVPVDLQVPIDLELEVPVQTTIGISTTVPFSMVIPVDLDLSATSLQGYLDELGSELEGLRDLLAGGWGPFPFGLR